jgi:hypothetical protein
LSDLNVSLVPFKLFSFLNIFSSQAKVSNLFFVCWDFKTTCAVTTLSGCPIKNKKNLDIPIPNVYVYDVSLRKEVKMDATEKAFKKRINIPKVMLEEFVREPRIFLDAAAPGYWPVPLDILKGNDFFEKLLRNEEFAKTHQVVIMRR